MALNRVSLIGNLGADPELRYTGSGDAVATLSIATTEKWKDKQGQPQEKTEWHRAVFFKRQAEVLAEHTRKGSKLYVEGSLTTRKWQDKQGNDRYTTEIKGRGFEFLDSKPQGQAPNQAPAQAPSQSPEEWLDDDSIPF